MMNAVVGMTILFLFAEPPQASDDAARIAAVRARFEAFNEAWRSRDMEFIRDFFSRDEEMLLFFERRQLRGFRKVETLYENMFAHALPGSVELTYSNLDVRATTGLAFLAANFHLRVENPRGETMTDTGRMTVVFEERDGTWKVVHRHTSFQAPPGPQRKVPLHTEPGPLWNPTLEGAWQSDGGATLIASASLLSASGLSGVPRTARYRVADDALWLSAEVDVENARHIELEKLTGSELVLRVSGKTHTFRRVE